MADRIRIIQHEAVSLCGSFEVVRDTCQSIYIEAPDLSGGEKRKASAFLGRKNLTSV